MNELVSLVLHLLNHASVSALKTLLAFLLHKLVDGNRTDAQTNLNFLGLPSQFIRAKMNLLIGIVEAGNTIQKAFLGLLLVISSSAFAGWVSIDSNEKQKSYADPSSTRKIERDDWAIMWSMIDLKEANKLSDGKPFLSWKAEYEFDCKAKKSRMLAATMYAEHMGAGEITNSLDFESPQWEAIPPDTNGDILWVYACKQAYQREEDAQKYCPSDTVVWLNLTTGVIHYKGEHWYGRTQSGAYVCKNEAGQVHK